MLSDNDRDHLAQFAELRELLVARVRTVALRHQTGAYLVGRPGCGKTHTVTETLDDMGAAHVLVNGRLSAAALFDLVAENEDSVVVIDDVPNFFKNEQSVQILMACLGGKAGEPRKVTYNTKGNTKGNSRTAWFSGGVVAVSNLPLKHDPLARALASRMQPLEYEPTDDMIGAFIREQTEDGYKGLTAEECREVADFVIDECAASDFRVDLRYYFKGLEDYLFCQNDGKVNWRALVASSMRRVKAGDMPVDATRADRLEWEREKARELFTLGLPRAERDKRWMAITGHTSHHSFYRRIKESCG